MPNWIEGTMKVRGTAQSVVTFLENAFDASVSKHTYGSDIEYSFPDWTYIKESRRAFVWGNIDCYVDGSKNHAIVTIPIRQAWSFTPFDGAEQRWINLSKEYSVDIRLQGFECGMEFYQDLEITNGEITIDRVIQYDNWDWECPMPRLGG